MKISRSRVLIILPAIALAATSLIAPANADSGKSNEGQAGVIYNSIPSPLPGNLPSLGFESVAFKELGNAVNFKSQSVQTLSKVVVTMSSWACVSGSWNKSGTCVTPEDASFSQPITLNIYGPSADGVHPGAQLASITKNFDIKYRPSASTQCTNGKWYDEDSKTCFNGLSQNISFEVKNVKVKGSAIFGITYNTTSYGYSPIGSSAPCFSTTQGCPYDSLNVALSQDPTDVSVGSSVDTGKLWFASTYAPWYTDGGAAGVGTFRLDSPNVPAAWGINDSASAPWYVPAFKVISNSDSNGDSHSSASSSKSTASHSDTSKGDGKHGVKQD
jgi:hypothetical protein